MLSVEKLTVAYGSREAVRGATLDAAEHEIVAIVGPANAGKTSLLRALNRMIDFVPGARATGRITLDGVDVLTQRDATEVRRRVAMVAPLPVGLPMTVRENVTFAARMAGVRDRALLEELTEDCLRKAALWDEVKDRLDTLGTRLSGGQQQRLTIARALSQCPRLLCLDEFSIAIDPVTTRRIEEALIELRKGTTILIVTNLVAQAKRLAARTAMMLDGQIVDFDTTEAIFAGQVRDERTRRYIAGEFG